MSLDFARNLLLPNPPLPPQFSSYQVCLFTHLIIDLRIYSVVTLKYSTSLSPESILDHALASTLPLATHFDPAECDPHLAVAISGAEESQDASGPARELTVVIARLWRSKAQALQLLPRIPAKLESRTLEVLLKERVLAFQGFDQNVWSSSLATQVHIFSTTRILVFLIFRR